MGEGWPGGGNDSDTSRFWTRLLISGVTFRMNRVTLGVDGGIWVTRGQKMSLKAYTQKRGGQHNKRRVSLTQKRGVSHPSWPKSSHCMPSGPPCKRLVHTSLSGYCNVLTIRVLPYKKYKVRITRLDTHPAVWDFQRRNAGWQCILFTLDSPAATGRRIPPSCSCQSWQEI